MRHFLRSLLGNETATPVTARPTPAAPRLGVIALEDRLTPANLLAAGLVPTVPVVAAGESLQATFAVVNVGTPAIGSWTDRIHLSADPVASADDTTLGTAAFSGGLGQYGMYTRTVTGTVPAATPTGIRYLIGTADAANQLAETAESDNTRATSVVVLPSALAGTVRTMTERLQSAVGGSLVPTAVSNLGTSTAVTFGITSSTAYRIGGFRVTDLQATVTITATGAVSATGTATLLVPTGSGNSMAVAVSFSANQTTLSLSGTAIGSFEFGTDPRVSAANATVRANLSVNLTTGSYTGAATATAANVSIRMGGSTVLSATNFQATITSAGVLTGSASAVSVLGGKANAAGVTFGYSMDSGRITGSATGVTGSIGAVAMSAAGATLVVDPGSNDPLLSVASAAMSVPMNGGSANVSASGFRLSQGGRYQFNSVSLDLPGQSTGGAEITGTFSGDVRMNGSAAVVTLNGPATVFGTPVTVQGELSSSGSGLFGFLSLRTSGTSDIAVLGQSLGFTYSGTARLMVNTTAITRTITAGDVSRSLDSGEGRVVADGTLSAGGFNVSGVLDVVPGSNLSARVTVTGELPLGQFGLLRVSGTFRVANSGLVGSVTATQVPVSGGFALLGTTTLSVNTATVTTDGIAPGVAVRASNGISFNGFSVGGSVRIGFRNNPGTADDFYFAQVSGNLSLFGGVATVGVSGEVRSNGFVRLTGATAFNLSESQTAGTGLSLNGTLSVELTRSSGTGAIGFEATWAGSVRWLGNDLVGASASIDASGHMRLTGTLFGVSMSWDFDL